MWLYIGLIILTFASLSGGCALDFVTSKTSEAKRSLPDEMLVKQTYLTQRAPIYALPLEVLRTPGSDWEGPRSLASGFIVADDGRIFISDNNGHAILWTDRNLNSVSLFSKSYEKQDQRGLKYPNSLRVFRDKVFVTDNDGIKVLNATGDYEKLIRTYFSIEDFAIDSDGNFLVNRTAQDGKITPLVTRLGSEGNLIQEFGVRPNSEEFNGAEGRAWVEVSGELVVVFFKHLPLVQIYDKVTGQLIRAFELSHPIFSDLKNLKLDKEFTNPRPGVVFLPRYFAGGKVVGDRIFTLLLLPNPEIVETDLVGRELKRYRLNSVTIRNCFGFDAQVLGESRRFVLGINEPNRSPTILALGYNPEKSAN